MWSMTIVVRFEDWRIRVNGNEYGIPHVHVEFRDGYRCSVAIDSRQILAGEVRPERRLHAALEWISNHAATLHQEYRRLNP